MLSQLVVHFVDKSPPELLIVANPTDAEPITFERSDERRFIPRLGTQDLLALAHYALRHGWEVDRLELQNVVTAESVDDREGAEASDQILSDLVHSNLSVVVTKFAHIFPAYSVVGVEFVRADDRAVTLRRNGVVDAEEGVSPLEVLEPAWRLLDIA